MSPEANDRDVKPPAGPGRWDGIGVSVDRGGFSWRRVLWSLIFPARTQRIVPTVSGLLLMMLSIGIGSAAYSSSNNILFIALSLMLACLILSGILSWLNFSKVRWRIEMQPPWRADQEYPVTVTLRNRKRVLPTYGLWFELVATSMERPLRLALGERLDPDGEVNLEWTLRPRSRGIETIRLLAVGSLFPFGFLKKSMAVDLEYEALVWPAPVEYRRFPVAMWSRLRPGELIMQKGNSGDLLLLRRYQRGDSHRQIHWKASARLRHLMVREFAAEGEEGFSLWLETRADVWTRAEQFELLCSFAATLAEDLFKAGRLRGIAVNERPFQPVKRVSDLEAFLDEVALLKVVEPSPQFRHGHSKQKNVITFSPEGARGVEAYVNGEKTASA